MEKNQNASAFPVVKTDKQYHHENGVSNIYGNTFSIGGLTKREYFAAMAMQGLLAGADTKCNLEELGKQSVLAADYVLARLEKI